jgi:hypothetical protein
MRRRVMCLVLAVPIVCGTLAIAVVAAVEAAGGSVFGDAGPANSAEAAAIGDAATVTRAIRFGDDPTRVHVLRPAFISPQVLRATTPEAAMWARQLEMIKLLDREGAIVGAETRRGLACLAMDLGLPHIAEYLESPAPACVPGAAMQRVLERTTPPEAAP